MGLQLWPHSLAKKPEAFLIDCLGEHLSHVTRETLWQKSLFLSLFSLFNINDKNIYLD